MELLTKIHEGIIYTEEWKPIQGYEDMYEVSSFGRVKSLSRQMWNGKVFWTSKEIVLKQLIGTTGYYYVNLSKDNKAKTRKVHQLVAEAFLGHIPDGTHKVVVDHISNNKLDNILSNLQLITQRENASKDTINKTASFTGVKKRKNRSRFTSTIIVNRKTIHLGMFDSEMEASEYYQNALKAIENGEEIVIKNHSFASKYIGVYYHKPNNIWIYKVDKKHRGCKSTE